MDRKVWPLIAAIALGGCQPQVPLENPFMPQTTVPPPGTTGTMGTPMYNAAPQVQIDPGMTAPNAYGAPATIAPAPDGMMPGTMPPATAPAQTSPYYPPGGTFDFRQGAVDRGSDSQLADRQPAGGWTAPSENEPELFATLTHPTHPDDSARASYASHITLSYEDTDEPPDADHEVAHHENAHHHGVRHLAAASSTPRHAADERPIRVEQPTGIPIPDRDRAHDHWAPGRGERTAHDAATSSHSQKAHVQTVAHAGSAQAASSQVARASYEEPVAARAAPPAGQFGRNDDYSQLTGQLEYSHATAQWKLRYIPIDGETDLYGGSVVISNSALLEGRYPGEFVTLDGAIVSEKAATSRFAPKFEVRQATSAR